jgi:two-component system sensor histidine kinase/response regulator
MMETAIRPDTGPPVKAIRILVVEDQVVVAADLETRLSRMGFMVCGLAASGEAAIGLAREYRPDLVLMDIRIQGKLDGIEAAAILRRELDLPVIFLSAFSDEPTLQRAKLVGPHGFLVKPFDERELRLNIEVALHKHAGERELAAAHREILELNASLEARVNERTAQLNAALNEIEGFVRAVVHHLRSPLRAMEGYSHLLQTEYARHLPAAASQFPQVICGNAMRMARLVDDLVEFVNLRGLTLCPARVDIAGVAREVLDELIAAEPGRQLDIHIAELPACKADPALLRRLLTALLSNALKFSRGKAPAVITVGVLPAKNQKGQHVYFIRDNGIGFEPRYAHKLFKLFSQLNLPEAFEGTGAGLAMATRCVERMSGRLWAEPLLEGGASFFFCLPDAT